MLNRLIPIALTPFRGDGTVDLEGIAHLTAFYREAGASAIAVLGIMGEAHALTDREREAVIEATVASANGVPVIAAVSAPATEVAMERARRARALGADYIMAAPPANVSDTDALVRHFKAVASSADLPWILQDEPVTTGVRLTVAAAGAIASAIPGLQAIKVEDVPTASKIAALRAALPQLGLFGGLGGLYLFEELVHGSTGTMTGFSYPDILAGVIDAYQQSGPSAARALFYRYLPLIRYEAQLGVKGIAIRKALFHRRGIIGSAAVRAPSAPADLVVQQDLLDLVEALGLPLAAAKGSV
jgi:4-hydroxy-tetrahydrodipicolinate synthase